jgi:hypothetical protein
MFDKLNNRTKDYKDEMISHIKLPVYIFSKRILKNYE